MKSRQTLGVATAFRPFVVQRVDVSLMLNALAFHASACNRRTHGAIPLMISRWVGLKLAIAAAVKGQFPRVGGWPDDDYWSLGGRFVGN